MDLRYQKRLASDLLGIGESRIKFNPEKLEEISNAVTRRDIERLVKSGAIIVLPKKGVSRARVKKRRKGPGRRKGGKFSTLPRKKRWIRRIRALRRALKEMRDSGKIDEKTYRHYYSRLANFHSIAHLRESIMKEAGGISS
ncbi:MAG: 50S ribosomal protein L19e [Candidatus Methanodesulfokora sp.]|jgi:large subunit ribosomal protein L19e